MTYRPHDDVPPSEGPPPKAPSEEGPPPLTPSRQPPPGVTTSLLSGSCYSSDCTQLIETKCVSCSRPVCFYHGRFVEVDSVLELCCADCPGRQTTEVLARQLTVAFEMGKKCGYLASAPTGPPPPSARSSTQEWLGLPPPPYRPSSAVYAAPGDEVLSGSSGPACGPGPAGAGAHHMPKAASYAWVPHPSSTRPLPPFPDWQAYRTSSSTPVAQFYAVTNSAPGWHQQRLVGLWHCHWCDLETYSGPIKENPSFRCKGFKDAMDAVDYFIDVTGMEPLWRLA